MFLITQLWKLMELTPEGYQVFGQILIHNLLRVSIPDIGRGGATREHRQKTATRSGWIPAKLICNSSPARKRTKLTNKPRVFIAF